MSLFICSVYKYPAKVSKLWHDYDVSTTGVRQVVLPDHMLDNCRFVLPDHMLDNGPTRQHMHDASVISRDFDFEISATSPESSSSPKNTNKHLCSLPNQASDASIGGLREGGEKMSVL